MNKKILIFTATYNEAENIRKFIEKILELNVKLDLLVIDDNSPDETWKIVNEYKKENENIILVKRENKEGLDTAHKLAFNYAKEHNYDYLITMDADLSHDPKEIPKIINLLDNNAFVIGSRYMPGGKNDMTKLRLLLSIVGNKFIKIFLGSEGTEFTSSFRGFNLNKIKNFHFKEVESKGYSFFMETVIRINMLGHKSYEIPIHFKNREFGTSKIPKIEIFRTLFNVFKLFLKKNKLVK